MCHLKMKIDFPFVKVRPKWFFISWLGLPIKDHSQAPWQEIRQPESQGTFEHPTPASRHRLRVTRGQYLRAKRLKSADGPTPGPDSSPSHEN